MYGVYVDILLFFVSTFSVLPTDFTERDSVSPKQSTKGLGRPCVGHPS